jgi:hypothetical protein
MSGRAPGRARKVVAALRHEEEEERLRDRLQDESGFGRSRALRLPVRDSAWGPR